VLKNLRLDSFEDGHNESSVSCERLNSREGFLLGIDLGRFFLTFFLIMMSTVCGSSPSSTFGGTKGIGGVSPGSRSPFGVEPRPEDFFFWALILEFF
jgi:hypothetical protein